MALGVDLTARWTMDEQAGSVMADSSGSGLHGTIGAGVAVGDGTYRFPGWTANVDGAGRLVGKVSAAGGAVSVPDQWAALEPGQGSFTVSLRLRSALTGAGRLPSAPAASFNIVQKGRADQAGRLLEARALRRRFVHRPAALGGVGRFALGGRHERRAGR